MTQDAHLFHETIRANLLYAKPDATEEELRDALDGAQILPLVESLPDGLDTVVGDRGYRLSGGEKQRIAIARLLLKAPDVVVLDEATAHLDSESEVAVQRALQTALEGRTSIVIAHRLSTVRGADQILVVADGRIVERGRHEELLAANGVYADLYRTQFERQALEEAGVFADLSAPASSADDGGSVAEPTKKGSKAMSDRKSTGSQSPTSTTIRLRPATSRSPARGRGQSPSWRAPRGARSVTGRPRICSARAASPLLPDGQPACQRGSEEGRARARSSRRSCSSGVSLPTSGPLRSPTAITGSARATTSTRTPTSLAGWPTTRPTGS